MYVRVEAFPPQQPLLHKLVASCVQIAESFISGRNQDVSWGGMMSAVFAGL
jgi:hypothetical protein